MEIINFGQSHLKEQYDVRIAQLKQIAQSPALTTKIMWDATAAKCAEIVGKIHRLMEENELKDEVPDRLDKQIQTFMEKCAKPEFHIALVGAIKAGKSSLINAILGEELASTEVTPETASLTKFCGAKNDYIKVIFYTDDEWDILWKSASIDAESKFMQEYNALHAAQEKNNWVNHQVIQVECSSKEELKNEIKKWSSSQSAAHYFVKEVEVGIKEFELPEGVIIVDTPGLNDAVEYRSDITKDYIDRANAVFVCVKADSLSGPELATICSVFSNARYSPEKVYIIATQQDSLNAPLDDWKKQRAVWMGHLKHKTCYRSEELANKNLMVTSGYFYTLLKNWEHLDKKRQFQLYSSAMKLECEPDCISERYDDLTDFTGIPLLRRRINNEIISKYKDLLIEDIKNSYDLLKDNISELLSKVREHQQEIIDISTKGIDEIKAAQDESKKKLDEAKQDQVEFEELVEEIKQQTAKCTTDLEKAIRSLGR